MIFKLRITLSLSIFSQEQRGFQDDLSICVIQVVRLVKKSFFFINGTFELKACFPGNCSFFVTYFVFLYFVGCFSD